MLNKVITSILKKYIKENNFKPSQKKIGSAYETEPINRRFVGLENCRVASLLFNF